MTTTTQTLDPESLRKLDAWWRAANYLSVGQIYLYDNPLLKEPLALSHIKPRLLGHWGTTPGLSFIYAHLNRVIRDNLVADVIDRVPRLGPRAAYARQAIRDRRIEHQQYIAAHGEDLPEVRDWKWAP